MNTTNMVLGTLFTPNFIESGSTIKGAGLVAPISSLPPHDKGLVISSSTGTVKAWAGVPGITPTLTSTPTPYSVIASDPVANFNVVGLESFNRLDYVDTDYDGRSDLEEAAEGTDVFDPGSCFRRRLTKWTFNDSWNTADGRAPLGTPTALRVSSTGFDGQALQAESVGQKAVYRDVELTGNKPANFNARSGTIRLFYKPSWTGAPGGTTELRLFEMGNFGLTILPDGKMELRAPGVVIGSPSVTLVQANAPWNSASGWYEITVSYSPESFDCYIVVNGTLLVNNIPLANRIGVQAMPPVSIRLTGFCIGNSLDGSKPARGLIDEVETYNYPMKVGEATRLWESISAEVINGGTGLRLSWSPGGSSEAGGLVPPISRHPDNQPSLDQPLTLAAGVANTIDDTTIIPGQRYHYYVGGRHFLGGVAMTNGHPVQVARGRMIIVPANNLWSELSTGTLASDYTAFKKGLVGDGWDVVETADQPLHPSSLDWGVVGSAENNNYKANLASTKNAILAQRDVNKLNVVLLLGHVTVPYSGTNVEDNHEECGDYHRGAWPADVYYGVTSSWFGSADSSTFTNPCATGILNNFPGDGKFDSNQFISSPLSSRIEMPVGRIDFYNMPAFAVN